MDAANEVYEVEEGRPIWKRLPAILLGAELNAERARGRQIAAGQPAEKEPYLPPRTQPASKVL